MKPPPPVVGKLGPAMLALPNDSWRAFAQHFVNTGGRSATECALYAGYADNGVLKTVGYRIVHDDRMQAAIQEETRRAMVALGPLAVGVVQMILGNDTAAHRDRLKAAVIALDRAGLHALSETKTTITHALDVDGQIERIMALCTDMGLDPKTMLGKPRAIDADFTVVDEDDDIFRAAI